MFVKVPFSFKGCVVWSAKMGRLYMYSSCNCIYCVNLDSVKCLALKIKIRKVLLPKNNVKHWVTAGQTTGVHINAIEMAA